MEDYTSITDYIDMEICVRQRDVSGKDIRSITVKYTDKCSVESGLEQLHLAVLNYVINKIKEDPVLPAEIDMERLYIADTVDSGKLFIKSSVCIGDEENRLDYYIDTSEHPYIEACARAYLNQIPIVTLATQSVGKAANKFL